MLKQREGWTEHGVGGYHKPRNAEAYYTGQHVLDGYPHWKSLQFFLISGNDLIITRSLLIAIQSELNRERFGTKKPQWTIKFHVLAGSVLPWPVFLVAVVKFDATYPIAAVNSVPTACSTIESVLFEKRQDGCKSPTATTKTAPLLDDRGNVALLYPTRWRRLK